MYKFAQVILPNMVLAAVFSAVGRMTAGNIGVLLLRAVEVSTIVFPLFAVLNFGLRFRLIRKLWAKTREKENCKT